jgi:hypothetical protein
VRVIDRLLHLVEELDLQGVVHHAERSAPDVLSRRNPLAVEIALPRCRFNVLRAFDPTDRFHWRQQIAVVGEDDSHVALREQNVLDCTASQCNVDAFLLFLACPWIHADRPKSNRHDRVQRLPCLPLPIGCAMALRVRIRRWQAAMDLERDELARRTALVARR